jgi:hypothetical protein
VLEIELIQSSGGLAANDEARRVREREEGAPERFLDVHPGRPRLERPRARSNLKSSVEAGGAVV